MVHGIIKPVLQYVVKTRGKQFQKYISKEYGQIAGTIAGTAIGIVAGEGIFSSINKGLTGDDSPYDRTPPFGYFDPNGNGGGVNGQSNSSFQKTHRLRIYKYGRRRVRKSLRNRCCCCRPTKYRRRSSRRRRH